MSSYAECTEVTPQCPVEATTYGYYPALGVNTTLLVVFGLCTLGQLAIGIKFRIRAFTFAATSGCLLEVLGYAGRLMMNDNPWSTVGFRMQITCIILGPSFLAAAIYLTLKHLVQHLGPEKSRLPSRLYPWIFITCDAFSIIAQAAGGGLAASGDGTDNLVDIGNNIIIAGIAFQVATMSTCFLLAVDFGVRLLRAGGAKGNLSTSFLCYLGATWFAFLTILIRCVYRIPEMAGGWGSELQRDEPEFLALDGLMIAIAAVLMTVAHPGFFFPQISSRYNKKQGKWSQKSEDDIELATPPDETRDAASSGE